MAETLVIIPVVTAMVVSPSACWPNKFGGLQPYVNTGFNALIENFVTDLKTRSLEPSFQKFIFIQLYIHLGLLHWLSGILAEQLV